MSIFHDCCFFDSMLLTIHDESRGKNLVRSQKTKNSYITLVCNPRATTSIPLFYLEERERERERERESLEMKIQIVIDVYEQLLNMIQQGY